MLQPPHLSTDPELNRVSSTQFKALQQGLPTSAPIPSQWRFLSRQVRFPFLGRLRLWRLSLLASLLTTVVLILVLRRGTPQPSSRKQRPLNTTIDAPFSIGCGDPVAAAAAHPRENAAFVILARNDDLKGVLSSMESLESHFNQWFDYPYIFLNNEPFSASFKQRVRAVTNAELSFGLANETMWGFPAEYEQDKPELQEAMKEQGDRAIMYGSLESYHHMCRFFSGFFFHHPLVRDLEYYWRVEPDVWFSCDMTYDPFRMMKLQNKVYGFVIAIKELVETVPNLFRYTSHWKRSGQIASTDMWPFVLKPKPKPKRTAPTQQLPPDVLRREAKSPSQGPAEDEMEGDAYNMCHFWSNFEIARVDFFQSEAYTSFFRHLDQTGGFWRERWGDAPVHTLAVAALLNASQVHYFRDIGYQHTTIQHCPLNAPHGQSQRPAGTPLRYGNRPKQEQTWDTPRQGGSGCRCTCLPGEEIEGLEGSCINQWAGVTGGWVA